MKMIERDKLIIRESFAMYYGGGEIWFEQLDALSVHKEVVKEKFLKDLDMIRRPSSPAFLAVNLNETLVDEELSEVIVNGLWNIGRRIIKVVFVGLDKTGKKLIRNKLRSRTEDKFVYSFMDDYEQAKEWLVQER
jgi:hypothetical protein